VGDPSRVERVESVTERGHFEVEDVVVRQCTAVDAGAVERGDGPARIGTEAKRSVCPPPRLAASREGTLEVAEEAVEFAETVQHVTPDGRRGPTPLVLVDEPAERRVPRQADPERHRSAFRRARTKPSTPASF
jgi:hypothetical protein